FLVDHSRRTAAIARVIARLEGVDALLPVVIALFHDAGKFNDGAYHADGIAEEEHAAIHAGRMLAAAGMVPDEIAVVQESLRALYDERHPCVGPSRIVQDADRLDKLGALGVGAFFTKATLRGRGLVDALLQTASRELTYALAAPRAMFTASGRRLATERAARTVAYFDELFADLEHWGIAQLERRTLALAGEFRTRDGTAIDTLEVTLVLPRACPACGGVLDLAHRRERGIKCEKLVARISCPACGHEHGTAFCLPVLA
ncbi:MAG: HD domain-containing protein, partial [Gammaproteobacteria bacterium]|nr:HD domain-containing protein [Gammaproteobacteria bacterium]